MARRYSRDNRGRFASAGTGATARGGRLRTAAGNKRATVTTKSGMVAQGRMTGAPLKGTIGKTDKSRLNINLTRPSKPGQRGAYNEARMQIRANKAAPKPTATTTKLGGRLNPAKKAFRAADKKFLSTIQKEKGISKAASDARRDAKISSDFTKTPTTKGPKINNTISQTKEKRDIETKQRLFKQRITRAYNLPSTGTDIKGRRTAKIKAKAIATLQGTKRPDVSDSTVGGLRRARTSTGYRAPSSRLPTPSRAARAQSRAQTLAKTQRFDAVGRRLGNPTKMDKRARTGARAVDFNNNPKAFLRNTLAQNIKSRGPKGTAGFVAKPRSLTQAPKRIKKATTAAPKPAAASKTPSNKIAASPRQLSRNEQTARDVMTNKSFRSDRQRIAEMQRRGIDRNADFVGLVANVRAKQGGGTTAKIKPASKPAAASKSTARPLSQRETQNLGLAKSNLAISKERLAFAREAKAKAKGPLEKLKATDRINEHQTNIRGLNKKITAINARPAPGRPITGADRSGNRKQLSAPRKSGAIKGSIKRDASASSKLKNKSGLNAGKFKNIYMANANKAAAAKRKRKP